MNKVIWHLASLAPVLLAVSADANVHVFVRDTNGVAWIQYECTAGEVVRAFAVDVTVARGQIVGVTNLLRGPSTAVSKGYGIANENKDISHSVSPAGAVPAVSKRKAPCSAR